MRTAHDSTLDIGRLALLAVCLGVGWYFWDSQLLWPLKLLVVMMHESGHAIASLLVGGEVQKITLAANESGACLSLLPQSHFARIVVYSAGYVGSALAGALLLIATWRYRLRRAVLYAACGWLGVMTLLYVRDLFTLAFCVGTALALGAAARWFHDTAVELLNLFLAAFTALYVVFDLRSDLWDGSVRRISDAALLAKITWIPSLVWAALWTVLSLTLLGFATWWALQGRPEPLSGSPRPRP